MDMQSVKLVNIKVSQHNARRTFDEAKMKELTASVKEKGILNPILIRPSNGKYELVCGERRMRAAAQAGLTEIPAMIRQLTDQQALECMVIENLQREDVHPLEESEGYETLMKKHGYKDVKDIAAKVGKSPTYIYGRLKLCELIPENRKYFYDGKFSPSVALLVARVPKGLQLEAGKYIVKGGQWGHEPMNYKKAKEYIEEDLMVQLKEAQFDPKEKGLAGKCSCAECQKRTGNDQLLFSDVQGKDICTDPGCFKEKKQAYTQRTIEKLKKSGKEVIPQEEAKRLFRYENDESPEQKYVSLDEEHYYGGHFQKLRNVAKATKDLKVIYAIQPFSGKIIEMVDKKDLPKIMKNAGIKGSVSSSGDSVAKAAETRRKERIRKIIIDRIAALVTEHARKDKDQKYLRPLAEAFLHHAHFDEQRVFIQRKFPDIKGGDVYKEIKKQLANTPTSEMMLFCFEIILACDGVGQYYGGPRYGTMGPALCELYKIDIKKIEAQVIAELKTKIKRAPKGKVPKKLVK